MGSAVSVWGRLQGLGAAILVLLSARAGVSEGYTEPCSFNKLCSCSPSDNPLPEIFCYGVPFTRIPSLPNGHLYRVGIVGSKDIERLEGGEFRESPVSSFTLTHSNLWALDPLTFVGTEETLTTLDLSHNQLRDFPGAALSRLPLLQWLSLKGNKIEEVKARDFNEEGGLSPQEIGGERGGGREARMRMEALPLRSLLLSDNRLSVIQDQVFWELKSLQSLDLDGNMITRIEGRPFPGSLTSLSLAHNLLDKVPVDVLLNLNNIKWLQLRGNLIRHLPSQWPFSQKHIEIFDLSHNLISSLPTNAFIAHESDGSQYNPGSYRRYALPEKRDLQPNDPNLNSSDPSSSSSSVSFRDLHLDFNFLQTLPSGIFRNVSIQRLSLSNNRISALPDDIFSGPSESGLRALDLNFNLLPKYPQGLKVLKRVTSLFMRGNRLTEVDEDAFVGCKDHLQVLDLSSNLLLEVPSKALAMTSRLLRLNLQDNLILKIESQSLGRWAISLLSLSLSRNGIEAIEKEAFKYAKNLKELRLSYNNIKHASPDALLPLRHRLEVLELSYAITSVGSRVLQSVSFLERLQWLELDHNRLRDAASGALHGLPSLRHFDLEGNDMTELPKDLFSDKVHNKLRNIILSNNRLKVIEPETFSNLQQVVNIVLLGNQLEGIQRGAFKDLPQLQTVVLTRNNLRRVDEAAFRNLTRLTNVLLQQNRLREFSMNCFDRPGSGDGDGRGDSGVRGAGEGGEGAEEGETDGEEGVTEPRLGLYINASHNEITELRGRQWRAGEGGEEEGDEEGAEGERGAGGGKDGTTLQSLSETNNTTDTDTSSESEPLLGSLYGKQPTDVRILDVSNNNISRLPVEFMGEICDQLQSLYMSFNKLLAIPTRALEPCGQLQILVLSNNLISKLTHRTRGCCDQVQFLDLAHNAIASFSAIAPLLQRMASLKVLDLSHNRISSFPGDAFRGTPLEKVTLRGNRLMAHDIAAQMACFSVENTLRLLDLSENRLDVVPLGVNSCHNLVDLNLASNRIEELKERSFGQLTALLQLSLSNNPLKKISSKAFLHFLHLKVLKMNNASLASLPILPLPQLIHLELAENLIFNISSPSLAKARKIKYLDLSKNLLPDVPRHLWRYLSGLLELKFAYNPIDILDTASLADLKKLRHLDMAGLTLKYIDSRMLHSLKHLISIRTSTYPRVRSFRLHDLLAKSASLRSALIEVQESTLSHQIQWAFGAKLKELIITGSNLVKILPDAFLGLYHSSDLILRITDTNLTDLPPGLLRYLADVRYITIDLRRNQLRSLSPEVLQLQAVPKKETNSAKSLHKPWSTLQVAGGLLLEDNPWICTCSLLWLSSWIRRWMRETRKHQMLNYDVLLQTQAAALQGQCEFRPEPAPDLEEGDRNGSLAGDTLNIPLIDLYSERISCAGASNWLIMVNLPFILILPILSLLLRCSSWDDT